MSAPVPPPVPDTPARLTRVLAATDLSAGGRRAARRAAQLARSHRAALTLLTVIPAWDELVQTLAGVMGAPVPTRAMIEADAAAALDALAVELRGEPALTIDTRVAFGRPAQEIAAGAAQAAADLLVLGAHGAHPVRDLLLGTTVQKLLRTSPCPLLVSKHAGGDYARVLAPTDLSDAARGALVAAAALFPSAQLHVAHAFELPYEGLMQHAGVDAAAVDAYRAAARERLLPELARWADAAGVPPARRRLHVAHGYPPRCIDQWVDRCGADLVVMAPWSKPPIEAAFIGSVSLHTALAARCDVLLMRGGAAGRGGPPRRSTQAAAQAAASCGSTRTSKFTELDMKQLACALSCSARARSACAGSASVTCGCSTTSTIRILPSLIASVPVA